MANNYAINYDDERFKTVENEKQDKLNEVNDVYDNMINKSDQFYQNQINAAKDYANTQQDLQNQQTELAVNEINQAKEKAEKDYLKEQRGAYSDWQKQSNQYGANAEQMAANGLRGTGYSESSKISMYNTYQNRVSTARESYNLAVQNYDNGIAQARLANNSKLAEIAYQALQTELELSLNGFQYKNQLLQTKINMRNDIDNQYYNRWQNVLSQMNTENALKEQIRQYNEQFAYQKKRDKVADTHWKKEFNLAKKASSSSRSGGRSSYNSTSKGSTPVVKYDPKDLSEPRNPMNPNNIVAANKIYKGSKTAPKLSSKKAQNWINDLRSKTGNKISGTALNAQIEAAIKNKTLKKSDRTKILKSFGMM